jgi:ubiquinol-cytochrome c reductase cytochrome b subunit
LWLAYSPSTQTAWESVYFIQYEMTGGWLIRGIHHFAAQAMMLLLGVHVIQVVVAGAYRAPRELTFWSGLLLIPLLMVLAQTGYLLPWDQRGLAATKVATSIAGASPGIGPVLQRVAQGGPTLGHATLTRFFALHAGLLPVLFFAVLMVHRRLARRHRLTPKPHQSTSQFYWPYQAVYDLGACVAVLAGVLVVTIVYQGAELGGPAGLSEDFAAARPEWYFLFLFRLLRFEFVKDLGGLAFGGIYVPTAVMAVFVAMPFIARQRWGYRFNIAFLVLVGLGITGLTSLAVWEDLVDSSHQQALKQAHTDARRAVQLAQRSGIPAAGAAQLMREDPLSQGPRLFAPNCSPCHHYHGHDGTGRRHVVQTVLDPNNPKVIPPTAADLGNFGSKEWLTNVLIDFHGVFAPLKNAEHNGQNLGERFLNGDMANWSQENRAALTDPANQQSLQALVEYLAQQSGRFDHGPIDQDLAQAGARVFAEGKLASGQLTSACTDCHTLLPVGATEPVSENVGSGVPTLTGYGGKEWLRRFLKNPAHDDFYGSNNAMPGFESRLSDSDLDLLVRWLTGDYIKADDRQLRPQ